MADIQTSVAITAQTGDLQSGMQKAANSVETATRAMKAQFAGLGAAARQAQSHISAAAAQIGSTVGALQAKAANLAGSAGSGVAPVAATARGQSVGITVTEARGDTLASLNANQRATVSGHAAAAATIAAAEHLSTAATKLSEASKQIAGISGSALAAAGHGFQGALGHNLLDPHGQKQNIVSAGLARGAQSLYSSLSSTIETGLAKSLFGSSATSLSGGISSLMFGSAGLFGKGGLLGSLGSGGGLLSGLTSGGGLLGSLLGLGGGAAKSGGLLSGIGGMFTGLFGLLGFERGGIVPSAAGGWSVPQLGPGGVLANLHSNEMVLPANISQGLQGMIGNGGTAGGGHTFNIGISAMDAGAVSRLFMSNGSQLVSALNQALRHGSSLYQG